MGVLSEVVKTIDTSGQQKAEISETLDLMVELTKSKADSYKQVIEDSLNRGRILGKGDSTDSLFFPITSVKDCRVEYRCVAENRPTDIVEKIGQSISGMIDDHSSQGIVNGVANIINDALQPILGQSAGAEQYCSTTSTFIEGTGIAVNIVRLDCIIWGRSVSSESIKKQIDTTLACVAYKSVVNVRQLSFDDFRSVYAPIIEASGETDVLKALSRAKEVYDSLEGGSELVKNSALKAVKPLSVSDLIFHSDSIMTNDGKF
ncbi:MAG: hypothetical protein IJX24_06320 [Oscillospiraceae bacterium]|nr:hypothetical protein [Oscillospiraceae bacterium]